MTPHTDTQQPFAGRYELLEVLDSGGFANVWLAKHLRGGNQVALKIYAHQNDEGIESFRQEYAQFANLRHEALVNATDFDVIDNCPFLVMPYYSGGNAGRLVGQFSEANAAKLMAQVGGALAYLHAHNVVHQDVKPNNFLLDSDGNFLLSDLGLSLKTRATMLHPNNATASLNTQKGSTPPCYRAPELFGNRTKIVQPIKATDTWAFGASLFELITGDVPFGELGGIEQKADPSVPDMDKPVSNDLKKIITWCLDAETWGRPTAAKLAEWGRHFESTGVWLPENDAFVAKKMNPTAATSTPTHTTPTPQPAYNGSSVVTTPAETPSVSWPKWAAAAAVLLLGGVGVSKMLDDKPAVTPVVITDAPVTPPNNTFVPSTNANTSNSLKSPSNNVDNLAKKEKELADKQRAIAEKQALDKADLARQKQEFAEQQQREVANLEREKREAAERQQAQVNINCPTKK